MQNNKSYGIIDDEFNTKKKNENFASARSNQQNVRSQQSRNKSSSIVDTGFDIKKPKSDSIISQPESGGAAGGKMHDGLFIKFPQVQSPDYGTNKKKETTPKTNDGVVNKQREEVLPVVNKVYDGMQEKADKRKWDMPTEDVIKTQTFLNDFGYTDREGKALKVDGVLGPKTKLALEKHLQENIPKQEVFDMQTTLNKNGFKDKDGNLLKTDGILGKKTDSAANKAIAKLEKPENSIAISDQANTYTPIKSEEDKIKKLIESSKSKDAEITPGLEKYSLSATAVAATTVIGAGVADGLVTGGVYAFSGRRFGAVFINGFVEGLSTMTGIIFGGIPGTVIGSTLGSALGSLSEDLLYNKDKSVEDIAKSAAESAAWGLVGGLSSLYLDKAIELAEEAGSAAQTLMKYDEHFGKALKIFFEQVVNILSLQ